MRVRLLSTVPEAQLREDQSDLVNWTRGDRKARFEQTAERHAGLSQFAGAGNLEGSSRPLRDRPAEAQPLPGLEPLLRETRP